MIKINVEEHREKVVKNIEKALQGASVDVVELNNAEQEKIGHMIIVTLQNGMVFTQTNHETEKDKAVQDAMLHINNQLFEFEYYRVAQNAAEEADAAYKSNDEV